MPELKENRPKIDIKTEDKIYKKFRNRGIPITEDMSVGDFKSYLNTIEGDKLLINNVIYISELFLGGFSKLVDLAKSSNSDRLEAHTQAVELCKDMISIYKTELKRTLSPKQREQVYERLDNLLITINGLYKDLSRTGIENFNKALAVLSIAGLLIVGVGVWHRYFTKDSSTA